MKPFFSFPRSFVLSITKGVSCAGDFPLSSGVHITTHRRCEHYFPSRLQTGWGGGGSCPLPGLRDREQWDWREAGVEGKVMAAEPDLSLPPPIQHKAFQTMCL